LYCNTIKNGVEVTAPDTNENEVRLMDNVKKDAAITVWFLTVTAGTIQFAADDDISVSHKAWPVDSKIPITVHEFLRYKAASNTDKFVVTV
jgi:hypothetical protein